MSRTTQLTIMALSIAVLTIALIMPHSVMAIHQVRNGVNANGHHGQDANGGPGQNGGIGGAGEAGGTGGNGGVNICCPPN